MLPFEACSHCEPDLPIAPAKVLLSSRQSYLWQPSVKEAILVPQPSLQMLHELGKGVMGVVVCAMLDYGGTQGLVAVKMSHGGHRGTLETVHELKMLAAVGSHPNIIRFEPLCIAPHRQPHRRLPRRRRAATGHRARTRITAGCGPPRALGPCCLPTGR
jgi:hypothetical protein